MKLFRKEEGFTLVELMVVVLIIGILVAVAVPVFNSAKASAQKRACQSNQKAIESAHQTAYADDLAAATGATRVATATDISGGGLAYLVPQYVKSLKTCPSDTAVSLQWKHSGTTGISAIDVSCPYTGADHSR